MRPLLNYYGGKWNAAPWIIENFPEHEIYVEPFGGGASVLLRKPRSKREIYNDIDEELVNLFKMARDKGSKLKHLLELTPHSRTEYRKAYEPTKNSLERARRTIVKSYFGISDSMFKKSNGMRHSKTSNTCVAKSWYNYWLAFQQIIDRIQGVTLECLPWQKVIEKYDSPTTLFYMDPPYVQSTRSKRHSYRHEFNDSHHFEFVNDLARIKGMAVVSGYDHEIYKSLKWQTVKAEFKTQKQSFKTETLWLSPNVLRSSKQQELFVDG